MVPSTSGIDITTSTLFVMKEYDGRCQKTAVSTRLTILCVRVSERLDLPLYPLRLWYVIPVIPDCLSRTQATRCQMIQ